MSNMPKLPARRTVLKVGANAAWAVPAVQIAAAAPAFAGSGDVVPPAPAPTAAKLSVTATTVSQSGGDLTLQVSVKATGAAATGVKVNLSGDIAPGSPTQLTIPDITAGSTSAPQTVKVTLTKNGQGVVSLAATGTTANVTPTLAAESGGTTAYGTAVLAITNVTHNYTGQSSKTGTLSFTITSDYAPADATWTATLAPAPNTGGSPESATVAVPAGGSVKVPASGSLQWKWQNNGATQQFAVDVTGKTTNGGAAVTNVLRTPATGLSNL